MTPCSHTSYQRFRGAWKLGAEGSYKTLVTTWMTTQCRNSRRGQYELSQTWKPHLSYECTGFGAGTVRNRLFWMLKFKQVLILSIMSITTRIITICDTMEQSRPSVPNGRSAGQEIPRLLWNQRFIAVFTRNHHWTILIQPTSSHATSIPNKRN
jgi:hypothetical protein